MYENRNGSRVITYYIVGEGNKYPSFDWFISRVDMEEDKLSIFRIYKNSLHIYKSDHSTYYITFSTVQNETVHKFEGFYNYLQPRELSLTHQYNTEWKVDLEYIESIFCDIFSDLSFSLSNINIYDT